MSEHTKSENPTKLRIFDGYSLKTGQPTRMVGFRIYESQHKTLKEQYSGNGSVLVRLLLSKYLNGELPEIETQYKKLLALAQQHVEYMEESIKAI